VIILSDEDLIWTELTNRLDELGSQYGCSFVALPIAHRGIGTPDDEVARICRREGAAALLTANYKDFAAKLVYYQALLSAGVSAIVLRQPNPRMDDLDIDYQLALVEPHVQGIVRQLERTGEPLLFITNKSGLRIRRLQDLIDQLST
jgi:hypothetical protein